MPRFSYRATSHNAKFPDIPANKVYLLQSDMRQVSRIRTFAKAHNITSDVCGGLGCQPNYIWYPRSQTCGPCGSN